MRTNKECPVYKSGGGGSGGIEGRDSVCKEERPERPIKPSTSSTPHVSVAITEEQEEELEKSNLVDEDLINVEGTKVKISKTVLEQ